MSNTQSWGPQETKTLVWRMVKSAGARGIGRQAMMDALGKSATSVDWHLQNMQRDGHLRRAFGGLRGNTPVWVVGAKRPPIDGLVADLALEMIEDCPQGVAEDVLAREIGCSLMELHRVLQPLQAAGRVDTLRMPATHGGGLGWRLPQLVDMLHGDCDLEQLHDDDGTLQVLPVVEVDIDRIHHSHEKQRAEGFAAELAHGRLTVTSGSQTLALPVEHTRQLLAYLAPVVLGEACQ